MKRWLSGVALMGGTTAVMLSVAAWTKDAGSEANAATVKPASAQSKSAQIARGRFVVITHDCGGCHGGGSDPSAKGWLAGSTGPGMDFKIGPCAVDPTAKPCFLTKPRNLTPDNATGMGRFTERQVFNALRYGLRPGETPDVAITSSTPGKGNFPTNPKYLAPPMPWMAWRHMPEADLWAMAAYLKNGVKPVVNKVDDSEGPPDFWASDMTVANIGPYPAKPFPTANEKR